MHNCNVIRYNRYPNAEKYRFTVFESHHYSTRQLYVLQEPSGEKAYL